MGSITMKYKYNNNTPNTNPPQDAGTYIVTMEIAAGANFTSATVTLCTLTISKIDPVAASHLTYTVPGATTYDGLGHPMSAAPAVKSPFTGMGSITVSYNGSTSQPINAATYTVAVAIGGGTNFNAKTLTLGSFTISKATLTKEHLSYSLPTNLTYTGQPQGINDPTPKTPYSNANATVTVKYPSSNAKPVNAGTYTVKVDITGGQNFNNVSDLELGTFTIAKATPASAATYLSYTLSSPVSYDGQPHGVGSLSLNPGYTSATLGAATVRYAGNATAPTDAGSYPVTVDISGGTNFNAATGLPLGTLTINRIAPTAGYLSYSPASATYNGQPQGINTPTLNTAYSGLGGVTVTYNSGAAIPTNAGKYAVRVSIDNTGKNFTSVSGLLLDTFTIGKATLTKEHFSYSLPSATCDGQPHGITTPTLRSPYTNPNATTTLT